LREPYTEIHDEAEAGQVVIVIELPDVDPEKVQLEVFDDVLIVRAEGPYCRYEKEVLLPVMVEPEPESCNFQNGLFEIRLRRQKI
jgi:HSP20 family protein